VVNGAHHCKRGKILKIEKVCLVINLVQPYAPARGGFQ
jgi:hypothetical protein